MNWGDLDVVLAVSRCGSLTAAAKVLGVNQATVTRRLDAVEQRLGARLFERTRRGVQLTPIGKLAVSTAQGIEESVALLLRQVEGQDARLEGDLRVTTSDMLVVHHPKLFGEFAARYPGVSLEVTTDYRETSLALREADLALRLSNRPDPTLFGRRLGQFQYAAYAAETLVNTMGDDASLEEYPWLAWASRSDARVTKRWMKQHVPRATVVYRCDSVAAMHAAVLEGVGVAFMPCVYGDSFQSLKRLAPVEPEFAYDLWALTHVDLKATARVRAFMEYAGAYFDAKRSLLAGTGTPRVEVLG